MDGKTIASNNGGGMDLVELWHIAKKNFLFLVITTLICTIIGAALTYVFVKPKYAAEAKLMISYVEDTENAASERNALLNSRDLMTTFSEFIKTNLVVNDVKSYTEVGSEKFNKNIEANFKKELGVSFSSDSLIVKLTYTSETSAENAIATLNQVVDSVLSVSNMKLTDGQPKFKLFYGVVEPIDAAESVPSSSHRLLYVALAFIVGAIGAYLFVLIKHVFDDTIKSKSELEKITGFRAIAFIEDIYSSKNSKGGNK